MRILFQLIVASSILMPFGGSAHRRAEQGNRHYEDGEYDDALRLYTEAQVDAPRASELFYDIGNVLYRQGDFEGAAEAFTRSLLMAPAALEGDAAYNLGNARFRLQEFEDAVKHYERALRIRPADRDAKRNLELALRAQDQQQQQQDQQQQQQDQQQDQQEQCEQGQEQCEQGQQQQQDQQEQQQQQQQQQEQEESDDQEQEQQQQQAEGQEQEQQEQPPQGQPGEMTPEDARRMLDGLQEQELENLREHALEFAEHVLDSVPHSRERSLAITKIEEAVFWANAGIARRDAAPPAVADGGR